MASTSETPIVLSSSSPIAAHAGIARNSSGATGSPRATVTTSPQSTSAHFKPQAPGDAIPKLHPRLSPHSLDRHNDEALQDDRVSSHFLVSKKDRSTSGIAAAKGGDDGPQTETTDGQGTRPTASVPEDTAGKNKDTEAKQGTKRKRKVLTGHSEGIPKPRKRVAKVKDSRAPGASTKSVHGAIESAAKPPKKRGASKQPTPSADFGTGKDEVSAEISRHFPERETVSTSGEGKARDKGKGKRSAQQEELGLPNAPDRRRSWTPILGDELPPSNQQASDGSQDAGFQSGKLSVAIQGFAYPDEAASTSKAVKKSTAAVTRKKKLESSKPPAPKRKPAAPKKSREPKKPKEPKAPKVPRAKKPVRPKTVTDYAIAAYRKPVVGEGGSTEHAMTEFFKPTGTQIVQLQSDPVRTLEPNAVKPSERKTATAVVQFQFPPPDKARRQMRKQDFMFGTSSQLAKDDSPRTHRMMQQAIMESEEVVFVSQARSSDVEKSPSTSRARVAHAPHGTSMSIGPGDRNLWAVSARDQEERMFAGTQKAVRQENDIEWHHLASSPPAMEINDCAVRPDPDLQPVEDHERLEEALPGGDYHDEHKEADADSDRHDSGFVDISDIEKAVVVTAQASKLTEQNGPLPDSHCVQTIHPAINKAHDDPPIPTRPALQVIDLNTSPAKPAPSISALGLKPTAVAASPPRKIVARKAADVAASPTQVTLKRPRGRPRKDAASAAVDKSTSAAVTKQTQRPKKPRAKDSVGETTQAVAAPSTPAKRKQSKTLPRTAERNWVDIDEISDSEASISTPSPPRKLASSPPSSPKTLELSPDPASAVRTKAKKRSASPAANAAAVTVSASLKAVAAPDEIADEISEDETVRPQTDHTALFKTITSVVKTQPRSNDHSKPSWYEKILMYDPIVLEDLTAWLVSQGVKPDGTVTQPSEGGHAEGEAGAGAGTVISGHVEIAPVSTSTGKGKSRGKAQATDSGKAGGPTKQRKGKAKAKDRDDDAALTLKPWAVQRWCEAHSICCLWKEGLRGGVKRVY